MKNTFKIIILFIIVIVLSSIVSPYTGKFFEKIIGHSISSWMGGCAECYEGFFLAFTFFSGLLFFGLLDKKIRFKVSLIFILVSVLLLLIMGQGEAFLISLGFGAIGMGLGQIVYLIKEKK